MEKMDTIDKKILVQSKCENGHFYKLLCEEIIFPQLKKKIFFPRVVEISILRTKVCGNAISIIKGF